MPKVGELVRSTSGQWMARPPDLGKRQSVTCGPSYDRSVENRRLALRRTRDPSVPRVHADAPKVVWALDFQFDSTIDGKAVKIASMIDEHTRESLLHLVERSITAQRLVLELEDVFDRVGGPPIVLHMDNGAKKGASP